MRSDGYNVERKGVSITAGEGFRTSAYPELKYGIQEFQTIAFRGAYFDWRDFRMYEDILKARCLIMMEVLLIRRETAAKQYAKRRFLIMLNSEAPSSLIEGKMTYCY